MNQTFRLLTATVALAAASVSGTSAAHAQTVIASLPYTITAGGTYVLNSDLSSSLTKGNLITVDASNVTIDFQGHVISGALGHTSQTAYGISAYERSNLTVKNGTIQGCYKGIYIQGNTTTSKSVNHQIDNMRMTSCYSVGIEIRYSSPSRITNCLISQIGGGTPMPPYTAGISIFGAGVTIQGNSISNIATTSGGGGYCISGDLGSFVRSNQFSNAAYGVSNSIYQDNLADNCATAFVGGTDGGGNVHD